MGEPMKPATNRLRGAVVQVERCADLLDASLVHDRDAVGERHGCGPAGPACSRAFQRERTRAWVLLRSCRASGKGPLLVLILEANDGHFGQGTQSAEV
jgi:hypothetical protein